MPTMNQDQMFQGVTVTFFDSNTPPRPARIDVSDRQPNIIINNPAVATVQNVNVSPDGMTLTFDLLAGIVGDTEGAIDVDVDLDTGEDVSLVVSFGDVVTVTPGPAGQAASGNVAFPAPVPKT